MTPLLASAALTLAGAVVVYAGWRLLRAAGEMVEEAMVR